MKGSLIFFPFFLLLRLMAFGQIELADFVKFECSSEYEIGYEFNSSFASPYSMGITVIDKIMINDELKITIGRYGNCADADSSNIVVKGDTIILIYGPEISLITTTDGETSQFTEIALCDCCLNFQYTISGLDTTNNYYLKLSHLLSENFDGVVFDVTNNEHGSIYYQSDKNLKAQLQKHIDATIIHYTNLLDLYTGLSIDSEDSTWSKQTKQIEQEWREFFSSEKALKDPFVISYLKPKVYSRIMNDFNLKITVISQQLTEEHKRLNHNGVYGPWLRPMKIQFEDQ